MIPINPHLVQSTLLALPVAIAVSQKLLRQHNETCTQQDKSCQQRTRNLDHLHPAPATRRLMRRRNPFPPSTVFSVVAPRWP